MATSVQNTNNASASNSAATPVILTNVTPPTAGIATANSSISSAAENQGFSAQCSAWISSVVDTIRNCLSKLPVIGYWFEKSNPAPVPVTVPGPVVGPTWSDAELLGMIRGQFVLPAAATPGTTHAIPAADSVAYALGHFNLIQSPELKMDAFVTILTAVNSTDDIVRQFYNALPEGTNGATEVSKVAIRRHIWIANGQRDGGDPNYGATVMNSAPRGPVVLQAAQDLRTAIIAAAPVIASSSANGMTSPNTVVVDRAADARQLNAIRNIFSAAEAQNAPVSPVSLNQIVQFFNQIQDPVRKLEAFQLILTSPRSNNVLMLQCFNALPVGSGTTPAASRQAIQHQIWEANGQNNNGNADFGAYVVANLGTPGNLALLGTAVQNLRTLLATVVNT